MRSSRPTGSSAGKKCSAISCPITTTGAPTAFALGRRDWEVIADNQARILWGMGLRPGDTVVGGPRRVTEADVAHFAEFTGDTFYAHLDAEAAAANPFFGERVAHGYLVVSFAAGLFVDPAPGPVLANFGVDDLRFLTPVKFDDELRITLTAKQISPRASAAYGEVRWDAEVVNGNGDPVAKYDVLTLVAKRSEAADA